MLKLIQNEWMKLWHKKGTWAMVAMLILVILVPAGITKYYEVKSPDGGLLAGHRAGGHSIL